MHLGLTGCRAEAALAFLKRTPSDRLYLVGDIIDLWTMRRRLRWMPVYNKLVRHILKRAQRGQQIVYLPGNHDSDIGALAGIGLVNIQVARQVIHDALDGRRLLVTHGDEADALVKTHPLLARVGAHAYDALIWANAISNHARALVGLAPWSFSHAIKAGVKRATVYITNFEQVLAERARAMGAQGVICGHIHQPVIRDCDGIAYLNCGDWVEHTSAIVEHRDGRFELLTTLDDGAGPADPGGDAAGDDEHEEIVTGAPSAFPSGYMAVAPS